MNKPPVALHDRLAPDLRQQQILMTRLQTQLHRFGYEWVDTPLLEPTDLFLIKAGDAAISRLISFEVPGLALCLRPEFTAPAARLYVNHLHNQPGPVRLQFAGPILRYESLVHGEIVQQNAIGAELINEDSPAADAEVIALVAKMLEAAGIADSVLVIGHTGLIEQFLQRYGLNRQMRRFVLDWLPALNEGEQGLERALETLNLQLSGTDEAEQQPPAPDTDAALQALLQATPQRGPSGGRTRAEIVQRLLSKQQQSDQHASTQQALQELHQLIENAKSPAALLDYLNSDPLHTTAQKIVATFSLLQAYGVATEHIVFDLSFTRNLDYYTGIVFEYRSSTDGEPLSLGGGGRYDELIGLLGAGHRVPAVGFMVSVNNVLAARHNSTAPGETSTPHVLLQMRETDDPNSLIAVASALRENGLNVSLDPVQGDENAILPHFTHVITTENAETLRIVTSESNAATSIGKLDLPGLLAVLEKTS